MGKKVNIGVVGSGPAGLVSSLGLEAYTSNEDCDITLLDKNKSLTDYPGVEYGIQERACKALERLGIKEKALNRGVRAHEITFYNSRLDKKFRMIKSNSNYTRCVVRQEFLNDLSGLLERTQVLRQCTVYEYQPQDDGTVKVLCEHSESGPKEFEFDLVIACDGSFSNARKQFFPESASKTDRGFSCIYMLIEAPNVSDVSEKFLELANGGKSEIIMGSKSTMTLFPLGKNRLAYGIGFDHQSKKEIWESLGLADSTPWKNINADEKKQIAQKLVADATPHEKMYEEALDYIQDWDSYKIYLWKMADTDALIKPSIKGANMILIGDASHAIMPTIGMGASLAIEDAELLARKLSASIKSAKSKQDFFDDLEYRVFAEFEKDRVPVWIDLVKRARLAARENFIDVSSKKRFAIAPAIPNNTLSRVIGEIERWLRVFNI